MPPTEGSKMSLASDLEKLQRQKQAEIRTLHQTYIRTKRTVIRSASPARMVRRHMGLSLGAAALVGLLLAPRPSPAAPRAKKAAASAKGGILSHFSWLKKIVGRVSPQAAALIPDAPEPPSESRQETSSSVPPPPTPTPEEAPKKNRILGTLLKEAAALALSKMDFHKLMSDLMMRAVPPVGSKDGEGSHPSEPWPEPHVSVADAGTVQPHDYENFQ